MLFITPFLIFGLAFFSADSFIYANTSDPPPACGYKAVNLGFETVPCPVGEVSDPQLKTGAKRISFPLSGWKGEFASRLYLASGEKSVVAGRGQVMAMAILETASGQTVSDGTPVDFYRDGTFFARGVSKGGLAHALLNAPTRAGSIEITARAENINTMANYIRVLPADPVRLTIKRSVSTGITTSETEAWIKTGALKDQFGNCLSDGSYIQFAGKDVLGRSVLFNSVVINGVASAKVLNRNLTESVKLGARLKNVVGEETSLSFRDVELAPQLPVRLAGFVGQLEVKIGPVLRQSGSFVPDGTLFKIITEADQMYNSVTVDGYVVFRITLNPKGEETTFRILAGDKQWVASFNYLKHRDISFNLMAGDY